MKKTPQFKRAKTERIHPLKYRKISVFYKKSFDKCIQKPLLSEDAYCSDA